MLVLDVRFEGCLKNMHILPCYAQLEIMYKGTKRAHWSWFLQGTISTDPDRKLNRDGRICAFLFR